MKIPKVYTPAYWSEADFEAEANRKRRAALRIVFANDGESQPSCVTFIGPLIVVARVDYSNDPDMIVMPIADFLAKHRDE